MPCDCMQEERTVSLSYTDPWVFNNKRRVGTQIELQNSRSNLWMTHGRGRGDTESPGQGLHRTIGGMDFGLPLRTGVQAA